LALQFCCFEDDKLTGLKDSKTKGKTFYSLAKPVDPF